MHVGTRSVVGFAVAVLALVGPGVRAGAAQQQPNVTNFYPHQAPPGQSTLITMAVTGREVPQGAEIMPAQGVTVIGVKRAGDINSWVELTLEVAKDAAPGARTLVLLMPKGRTAPVTITIPTHAPGIADLRAVPGRSDPPTVDVQLTATDASADLGELPYVWFTIGCKAASLAGVVRGTGQAQGKGQSAVRASIPRPLPPGAGACDLQVRVTDAGGAESNTLRTTVNFTN